MAKLLQQKPAEQLIPASQELGNFQSVQQWQPRTIALEHTSTNYTALQQ